MRVEQIRPFGSGFPLTPRRNLYLANRPTADNRPSTTQEME